MIGLRAWLRRTQGAAAGVALALAATGPGCAPSPPAARLTSSPQSPPLLEAALTGYVPAAGLRWMVAGRPRELADQPGVLTALQPLVPSRRLDAYAQLTGIDLRRTANAVAAGFDYGTLYLVDTTNQNERIEQRFVERLTDAPIVREPHPRIHRILGLSGETPLALVSIHGKLAAFAVGDTTQARIVEAFARRQLRRSPSAMAGAALSTLPADLERAPVRFYAPGPFGEPWARAARGLLAASTALGATATPSDRGRVRLRMVLAGSWEKAAPDGEQRLLAAWHDLAASPTGDLLGLNEPAGAPSARASRSALELQVELDVVRVVAGLRHAVNAEAWEILDLTPPTRSPGEPRRTSPSLEHHE